MCPGGRAGGGIKNPAINYVRNRKLDDRVMEGNEESYMWPRPTDPS